MMGFCNYTIRLIPEKGEANKRHSECSCRTRLTEEERLLWWVGKKGGEKGMMEYDGRMRESWMKGGKRRFFLLCSLHGRRCKPSNSNRQQDSFGFFWHLELDSEFANVLLSTHFPIAVTGFPSRFYQHLHSDSVTDVGIFFPVRFSKRLWRFFLKILRDL